MTNTDPRVQHAMGLIDLHARSDAPEVERAAITDYLAAEFAKVPSAPVEAVPVAEIVSEQAPKP